MCSLTCFCMSELLKKKTERSITSYPPLSPLFLNPQTYHLVPINSIDNILIIFSLIFPVFLFDKKIHMPFISPY